MPKKQSIYNESAITTLDPLTHIRLRTGMYIGRLGDGGHPEDGIYILLKEIVDNSIDEFTMGAGNRIDIALEDKMMTIRDYGRGIPLGKLIECVSQMNTGGKYNNDVFQFSVGLNGVGTKAVNALSAVFEAKSFRDGQYKYARFERGKLVEEKNGTDKKAPNGTWIRFCPDETIFKKWQWKLEFIERRLRYYAFLNSGLTLYFNEQLYSSQHGLKDLLHYEWDGEDKNKNNAEMLYDIFHHQSPQLEFAFSHSHKYGETYFSFVNGQYTNDGGTHQAAFREGLTKGINEYAQKNFSGEDIREGIFGAIAIKVQDPIFESQTKNKLSNTDIRAALVGQIKDIIAKWLHQNEKIAKVLLEKVKTNERIRREMASIRKEARERAKKSSLRIPKLIDCRVHWDDHKDARRAQSTLFLTEGDSAGGAMIQSRDVYTQAIFTLKGKPLNCYGLGKEAIYKNEEFYNIMRTLGVENDIEGLRYNRIVIATDADVDGMHIRNLLLTFFLRFFEDLVIKGHIYILETPLFRVRNKKVTTYCYNEQEKNLAMEKISHHEITRFKGLGEISPGEFKQFIGGKMRLIQVVTQNIHKIDDTLQFFMGKNTPTRKNFIINNLIADIGV